MVTTVYENTYASVNYARDAVRYLDKVVDFLRSANRPMSCAEIGKAIFGDAYGKRRFVTPSALSKVIQHLRKGGFLSCEEIDGEPVTFSREEYRSADKDVHGNCRTIEVHDNEGHTYTIANPKFDPWHTAGAEWVIIKQTVIPKVIVYKWVGD